MSATYIHGASIVTNWRDTSASLSDLIFRGVSQAIEASAVPIDQIESVVLSAHDIVDGRSLSSMVTAPAAGAYLRDEIRLAEDGLAAASLAAARIEAGETEYSIVAAWGRASEGNYSHTSRFAFDPFCEQPLGLDEFAVSALRMSAWAAMHGLGEDQRKWAADIRDARARSNPRACTAGARPQLNLPLRAAEAPRYADIVVAAILGRPASRVAISGFGHSAVTTPLDPAKLLAMPALAEAAKACSKTAGADLATLDVYQCAGATLVDEAVSLEALGLAGPGDAFSVYASDERINPSGGGAGGWCFPANGLVNLVEAFFQLAGTAGGVQLGGQPKRALATGLSPMGGQVAHCAILEAAA